MAKHSSHILDLARKGAVHRYEELRAEMASLLKSFPHLGGGSRRSRRPMRRTGSASAGSSAADSIGMDEGAGRVRRRRRRKMSAAAKKAVSERMKKYWAKRRKEKA